MNPAILAGLQTFGEGGEQKKEKNIHIHGSGLSQCIEMGESKENDRP